VGRKVKLTKVGTGAVTIAFTDGNGAFTFAGVVAGTYRITILKVKVP
jgi:hypothetical protein